MLTSSLLLRYKAQEYTIQMNSCINPYCSNFGMPQVQYELKGKLKRYKSALAKSGTESRLICNPVTPTVGAVWNCGNYAMSNWAIAEEIRRLAEINLFLPMEPEYEFHIEGCAGQDLTPFVQKGAFRKCGKSSGNSQKYQFKRCKKITNVLPSTKESTTYHQKRNDILPLF